MHTKILQVIILPRRTRTNHMSLKFLHEGILVRSDETLTKKRPSGHPDLQKFRTISKMSILATVCLTVYGV